MTDKEKEKRPKGRWPLWVALSLLSILIGLAPLLLLLTYTRSEPFWSRWLGSENEYRQAEPVDESETVAYLVQYLYRYCDPAHSRIFAGDKLPEGAAVPPAGLIEISMALLNSNLKIEQVREEINIPEQWGLSDLSEHFKGPRFLMTLVEDLCPDCRGRYFLGLFNNYIAVYEGCPPKGLLREVTDYPVKDIDRETLRQGVPFESEEQKKLFLESFTS